MKTATAVIAWSLLWGTASAAPLAGTSGNVALPLAATIGIYEPNLSPGDKKALVDLLDANVDFYWPIGRKIAVQADAVICKVSNVDITARSCEIVFGKKTIAVKGRSAHEIFATIAKAGVPSEGAAGSIYESVSHLNCVIDPRQIFDKAGAGADCKFKPGPP